jgi:addiction module HigA family antidote
MEMYSCLIMRIINNGDAQSLHPGEFSREVYLEPSGLSARQLAGKLGVSPSTPSQILNETSQVSPEMALRLSKALGCSPESWLAMQDRQLRSLGGKKPCQP